VEERSFIGYLLDKNNSGQIGSVARNRQNTFPHNWKIRLKEKEFTTWIQNCNRYCLFFDGASKSNLGASGAGGVILNANEDIVLSYEWGLGHVSNNRVEALALYQGLI